MLSAGDPAHPKPSPLPPPPLRGSLDGPVSDSEEARPRRNGWSCPWHPLQCLAWFFVVLFAVLYFGVLGHYVLGYWRIPTFLLPTLVLLVLVVAMATATTIDPGEPAVREKMSRGRFSRPKFDRSKFSHVIQNSYCRLCQLNVSKHAKHCRVCDKCILDFDHHCKWLNSCVGSRNYKWFLTAVVSALIGVTLFLLFSLSLFIVYFVDEDASLLRFNCHSSFNLTACDPSLGILGFRLPARANPVFPSLCAFCVVLSLIGLLLLGHLTLFHLYLNVKGQSTYEFFMQRRDEERGVAKPHPPATKHLPVGKKMNRVVPINAALAEDNSRVKHASLLVYSSNRGRGSSEDPAPQDSVSPRSSVMSDKTDDSIGITTFGRTPPPLDLADDYCENLTDEQKLDMVYAQEKLTAFEESKLNTTETTAEEPHPQAIPLSEEKGGRSMEVEVEVCDDGGGGASEGHVSTHKEVESESPVSSPQLEQDGRLHEIPPPPARSHHHHHSPHTSPSSSSTRLEASPIPPALPHHHHHHSARTSPSPVPSDVVSQCGLASRTDSPAHPLALHKKVSFQDLQQEQEEAVRPMGRPRPLPPIGSDVMYRNEPLPPHSRRLPPLQSDALSLYSSSSHSQLFSRSGSSYSLPLPDPRYSISPPRPLTPLGGGGVVEEGQRSDGRTRKKKPQVKRHSFQTD